MKTGRCAALLFGTVVLVTLTGCPEEAQDESPRHADDDIPGELREGLSPEELERRAEPIPQDEAERRGLIDTTIYVEDDLEIDTVFVPQDR